MIDFSVAFTLLIALVIGLVIYIIDQARKQSRYRAEYKYTVEDVDMKIKRSLLSQRNAVKGALGEHLAAHMKEFLKKYEPADARYMGGDPIDYIIFKGYNRVRDTDEPRDGIVFLEVKTTEKKRDLHPDKNEQKILDAIHNEPPRVEYDTITIHVGDST